MKRVYFWLALILFIIQLVIYFQNLGGGTGIVFFFGTMPFEIFFFFQFIIGAATGILAYLCVVEFLSDSVSLTNDGLDL